VTGLLGSAAARSRLALVCGLIAVQLALVVALCNRIHPIRPTGRVQVLAFGWSLMVLAVLGWAWRTGALTGRALSRLLLIGCACLQLGAVLGPPVSSDDDFRYVWDAKVQLAGIDPYRYAPSNPALLRLRGSFLFPAQQPCLHNPVPGGCTVINRPFVHTIYPPAAQLAFDAIWVASDGDHRGHLPFQLAAALGVLVTTMLLIRLANQRGSPLWPVAAWALSPIVAVEATNNAHIEWLVALLSVLALLALRSGRPVAAGTAIGAAIATNLYPGLMLVTAGRRPLRLVAAATGVLALGYLPHVLAVGPKVLGYLPGYLREENYDNGDRYILVSWFVGHHASSYLAPAVLLAALAWLWWRGDDAMPERTAVVAVGAYLLVTTPNYSWYALMLIALIGASGQLRWLWLGFAPTLEYESVESGWGPHRASVVGYGIALAIAALAMILDHGRIHTLWKRTNRRRGLQSARTERRRVPGSS